MITRAEHPLRVDSELPVELAPAARVVMHPPRCTVTIHLKDDLRVRPVHVTR